MAESIMEEWKMIHDFDDFEVSNLGQVRNKQTGEILTPRLSAHGYLMVRLWKPAVARIMYIHRLVAAAFVENPENKNIVDHIDNNRINNMAENLRFVTHQENLRNASLSRRNTSGVKGVSLNKQTNKYLAYITVDGIQVNLGSFDSLEAATAARQTRARQIFGEFANETARQ